MTAVYRLLFLIGAIGVGILNITDGVYDEAGRTPTSAGRQGQIEPMYVKGPWWTWWRQKGFWIN